MFCFLSTSVSTFNKNRMLCVDGVWLQRVGDEVLLARSACSVSSDKVLISVGSWHVNSDTALSLLFTSYCWCQRIGRPGSNRLTQQPPWVPESYESELGRTGVRGATGSRFPGWGGRRPENWVLRAGHLTTDGYIPLNIELIRTNCYSPTNIT